MTIKPKSWGIILLLTVLFVIGRISAYGILSDSIAAQDTRSYIECAEGNALAQSYYECARSATLPLVIQMLVPREKLSLAPIAEPFFGTSPALSVQPGTENWVIFQTLLSILAWTLFALTISSLLRTESAKIFAVVVIYLFAFVPQIADWDSLLLSESLSISLFIFMMTFFLRFLTASLWKGNFFHRYAYAIFFLISAWFWVFTRDTNVYFIALLAILLLCIFLIRLFHKKFMGLALLLAILLCGITLFQQITFKTSLRWQLPLMNNLTSNIFPYPDRVAFMASRGMPTSKEILSQRGSAEYNTLSESPEFNEWVEKSGLRDYQAFLFAYPLWNALQFYDHSDEFFSENRQPFFFGQKEETPHWAIPIGNLMHPLSASCFLLSLALLLILFAFTIRRGDPLTTAWFLYCGVWVAGSLLLIAIAFFGEVRSIWRHVLVGVMPLRLSVWILIAVLLDQAQLSRPTPPVITRLSSASAALTSGTIEKDF